MNGEAILEAEGVRKIYCSGADSIVALHGLDLVVPHGQFVAVMTQYQRNVQTVPVPAGGGGVFDVKIDQPGLYPFVSHSFAAVDLGQVGLLNVGNVKGTMSH